MLFESTICAPATSGSGAIAIIRLSGKDSFRIGDLIFTAKNGKPLKDCEGGRIVFGTLHDGIEILDEALVSVFRSPHSYTGEDSLEFSIHASPFVIKRLLEILIDKGAKPAGPGEFTQRAFLNGKMDLTQAEAVADLIASENRTSHRVALNQMRGGFSRELAGLRSQLLHFTSMIELELDFSEENVEFANRNDLILLVNNISAVVKRLIVSFKSGNVIKNGVPVAIIGKPNVGKSSLLNRLLNEDRAIVSEIAGTTRDSIEDTMQIKGITFRFIDTAGIRSTDDRIEILGISRTLNKIEQAEIILLLTDASESCEESIRAYHEIRKIVGHQQKKLILLANKSDLVEENCIPELIETTKMVYEKDILEISAYSGHNIERLKQLLVEATNIGKLDKDEVVITNIRHYEALTMAYENIERVSSGLTTDIPSDLIAQDLRQVLHYLGEITGEITTDEVLGNIFRNFCIGK